MQVNQNKKTLKYIQIRDTVLYTVQKSVNQKLINEKALLFITHSLLKLVKSTSGLLQSLTLQKENTQNNFLLS